MLNRTLQPPMVDIEHIDFVEPEKYPIAEGIDLYHMKDVPNETARFDLYFDAGKCNAKNGIPAFVNGLLLSGTDQKSSIEINAEINSLGGFLESGISAENAVVSMYCLRENVVAIFNILIDAIKNVAFIEKEVDEYLSDGKQKLKINREKVSFLAQRAFQGKLFASNEMYYSSLEDSDFDNVEIDQLRTFHAANYLNGLDKVVVVGHLEESEINTIIEGSKSLLKTRKSTFDGTLQNEVGA
ncbi:MAG: insulinase family protein, partial [Crocinitomicaceae bacterium]|nr:insulinase family protein [Crocinitomicaceae bacterium]